MGGKSRTNAKREQQNLIDSLSCENVDTKPLAVDWREEWSSGGSGDLPDETFYESTRCQSCGEILTFAGGHSGGNHREVWADSANYDPDADDSDLTCDGYVGPCEGPMMNYAYPCDWKDGEAAARALVDLPLVPVVLSDGEHALALTGGGMDLSWEICHAYILLGNLPPLHHCADLPRYVDRGLGERQRLVLDAAERTASVNEAWAQRAKERIGETRKWLASETRRIAREKGRKS